MLERDWEPALRANLSRVRANIAAACQRAGRAPDGVRVVAVTKYVSFEVLGAVVAAGVVDLGENHAQQLAARARAYGAARLDWPPEGTDAGEGPRWHMIGHLQRNKIKLLLPHSRIIHSLDSERLARAIEAHADALGVNVDVLIEVNISGESTKTGVTQEGVAALLAVVGQCRHLRLRGLMTMAPYDPDPEMSRPVYAQLRTLLERFRASGAVGPSCVHLSMGMSQDYAVAVEEGATLVRIGSALFEGLPTTDPRRTAS